MAQIIGFIEIPKNKIDKNVNSNKRHPFFDLPTSDDVLYFGATFKGHQVFYSDLNKD